MCVRLLSSAAVLAALLAAPALAEPAPREVEGPDAGAVPNVILADPENLAARSDHRAGFADAPQQQLRRAERASLRQQLERDQPRPGWYAFVADDDEALAWAPNRDAALQPHVELADTQVGIAYQRGDVQTAVTYFERDVSVDMGTRSVSEREGFAGVTVSMRR